MTQANYSIDGLDEFLVYAGEKGLLNSRTAAAHRSALAKIKEELTDPEAADVRQIDVDSIFQRYLNRNKVTLSPRSLKEYKRRLAASVREFVEWQNDPSSYKPKGQEKAKSGNRAKGAQKAQQDQRVQEPSRSVDRHEHRTILTIPYPLRSDFVASVQIPRDMKSSEARRLAAFIETLAIDFEP